MIKNRLLTLLIPVLLISCSHKQDSNIAIYKALNEQLVRSTEIIKQQSSSPYQELDNKLRDSATAGKARRYYAEAMMVRKYSDNMVSYIDSLKECLTPNFLNTDSTLKEDNKDAVTLLFETNGKGKELQQKLDEFKEDILSVDSDMTAEFKSGRPYLKLDSFSNEDQYLQDSYTISALATLSKLQNKIRIIENAMATYCNDQTFVDNEGWTRFEPVVCISSTQVKAGQNITLEAGVGAFTNTTKPTFTINGKKTSLNDENVANYTIRTLNKSGNYTAHVKIEYTKPDGTKDVLEKDVEYTVVK